MVVMSCKRLIYSLLKSDLKIWRIQWHSSHKLSKELLFIRMLGQQVYQDCQCNSCCQLKSVNLSLKHQQNLRIYFLFSSFYYITITILNYHRMTCCINASQHGIQRHHWRNSGFWSILQDQLFLLIRKFRLSFNFPMFSRNLKSSWVFHKRRYV